MRLYPSHIFSHKGGTYILNPDRMYSGRVSSELIRLKEKIEDEPDYQISLTEAGLLERVNMIMPENGSGKRPLAYRGDITNLSLMISQRCNLNCIYCFGDGGTYGNESGMDRETAFKAIDWLIGKSKRSDQLSISFFGGEPLLNFKVIQATLEYAEEQGRKKGKTFFFTLVTNGTLLNDEIVDFLNSHNIMVKVSIDGDQETHDRQRPFKNGGGSYRKTIGNLQRLLDTQPLAACRATILGQTSPLLVKDALQDLGFRRIEIQLATPFPSGKGNASMRQRNTEGMIDLAEFWAAELLHSIENRDTEKLKVLWKSTGLGVKVQCFLRHRGFHFFCGAGNDSSTVDVNGDIYLCPSFVGNTAFRLGNIGENKGSAGSFRTSQLARQNKCNQCFARHTCGGGCYYDNLAVNGSVYEPSEDLCVLERRRAELAAYINAELGDDDVRFLEKNEVIPPRPWYDDLF